MAMRRSNAAGGLGSSVVNEQGQRLGARREGITPGFAGQLGQAQGDHVTNRSGGGTGYRGDPMMAARPTAAAVPLGNQLTNNVGAGGPGKGREVFASGSQGMQGQPAQGMPGLPSTKGQWPD
jgi:hypothetical protein